MTPDLQTLLSVKDKLKLVVTNECVNHSGTKDKDGYRFFQFRYQGKKFRIRAHRASYMIYNQSELNSNTIILHACDNRSCMNPKHLTAGTHIENMKDMVAKGRSARGVNSGNYKHGLYSKY